MEVVTIGLMVDDNGVLTMDGATTAAAAPIELVCKVTAILLLLVVLIGKVLTNVCLTGTAGNRIEGDETIGTEGTTTVEVVIAVVMVEEDSDVVVITVVTISTGVATGVCTEADATDMLVELVVPVDMTGACIRTVVPTTGSVI